MPNLLRAALTAAVLAAIAVRLRRRARLPRTEPPAPGAALDAALDYAPGSTSRPRPRLRPGKLGRLGALVAATVAVLAALAYLGPGAWPGQSVRDTFASVSGPVRHAAAEPGGAAPSGPPEPDGPTSRELQAGEPDPCAPPRGAVTVRPVDPRVKRAVDRQWRRIERWLRANAPRTHAALGRPGRARTIAVAEAQMGVKFPDDLRASLLRHDGARGFGFGGAINLGVREIRDAWRLRCAHAATTAPAGGWDAGIIPFGRLPGRGGYAVTGPAGTSGRPTYYAMMRAVAVALETGTPIDGRRPAVRRGVLRWTHTR
ncbi:SMI1/KNR4 family protein [Nonomuraea sp. SBT364]|uniref:SMI1/KNR4 family protein n=1 Tax=Nonomuraea sp. SBT364 TaxID=1580530 RepID=UPI00066BCFCE|nr:SMI1/KNR4 family protein [Nonomuraea sp. SBT364]